MKLFRIGLLAAAAAPAGGEESAWDYLAGKYDGDADGKITRAEYTRDDEHWKRLDVDGNGWIDRAELELGGRRGGRGGDGKEKKPVAPREGEKAPAFALELLPEPGKEEQAGKKRKPEVVELASFRGKKPVALIFGSYT